MTYRLGVDVGGTFTDLLLIDEDTGDTHRAKTPVDPGRPVGRRAGRHRQGLRAGRDRAGRRSTTSCTAPRSRPTPCWRARAPRSGWSSTRGYRQVLQVARSFVPGGLAAGSSGPSPSRWRRWRTPSRRSSGSAPGARWSSELDEADLLPKLAAPAGPRRGRGHRRADQLLRQPAHERRIAELVAARDAAGRAGLAEQRDPAGDHGVRAHADDGGELLRPARRSRSYLASLRRRPCEREQISGSLHVLRSDGGLAVGRSAATEAPVNLLMSRPGRRRDRRALGRQAGRLREPAHLRHGRHLDRRRADRRTASRGCGRETHGRRRRRCAPPRVDVRTVGAGGGSIAHVPELTKALRVGPQSAGAEPGPAAYGRGGDAADRDRRQRRCSATCRPMPGSAAT